MALSCTRCVLLLATLCVASVNLSEGGAVRSIFPEKGGAKSQAPPASPTLLSLLEATASTREATDVLGSHHSLRFLAEKLERHGLPLEQVLIDLHHSESLEIKTSKARGKCEPSSWKYYASCMGMNSACTADSSDKCTGVCRCNTVGLDECECVRSLKEVMTEDENNALLKTLKLAKDDMVHTGQKVLDKVDRAVDFALGGAKKLLSRGVAVLKASVKKKIDLAIRSLGATREKTDRQMKHVETLRGNYHTLKGREAKKEAFETLCHEIGVLNGMEQVLGIRNILRKVQRFLFKENHVDYLLPDLLVYGANYGTTLTFTQGIERVIDFRTREIGTFTYGGFNVGANQLSLAASVSGYVAFGWQHSVWCQSLEEKYKGLFRTFDASLSIPGVTDWGLASVSAGGVAAVSAGGYDTMKGTFGMGGIVSKQCCPVWDAIKTLGFSVTGTIGIELVKLPGSVNMGCTDYELKPKMAKTCAKSQADFIHDLLFSPEQFAATMANPTNLLLTLGLALANGGDDRVAAGVCNIGPQLRDPKTHLCPCNSLPSYVHCCGTRKCKRCDENFSKKNRHALRERATEELQKARKLLVHTAFKALHLLLDWRDAKVKVACEKKHTFKLGSKSVGVSALKRLMYPHGDAEGTRDEIRTFDLELEQKVRTFQRVANLPVTGKTDEEFWGLLCDGFERNSKEEGMLGMLNKVETKLSGDSKECTTKNTLRRQRQYVKSPDVVALQKMLGIKKADGKFGPGTELAVIAFQKKHEIQPADGVVKESTWDVLCGHMVFLSKHGVGGHGAEDPTKVHDSTLVSNNMMTAR